ncbi:MAG: transposase [Rhodocyclaceae bacterium]|nr:transposase [Rhodocyclaceae bacterium]
MQQHPVILCLQDTTELDFNGQRIAGLGPLSFEAQRGMYLHPTYAVTPAREPLGLLDAWMWAREPKDADGRRSGPLESLRWIEGYERLAELAPSLPTTRLVYVADREADILALMQRAHALGTPVDWLLRSQHDRALPEGGKLWAGVLESTVLGQIEFTLPARHGQVQRLVRQEIRRRRIELRAAEGGRFEATCLIAREVDAPDGVKPIEWRLLTNREAASLEAAVELIDWYRARWEIELFFHVLKNGCRVEALQLASVPKIELALAVFLVVAWRLARLMRLGRVHPDLEAALFFAPEEWQAAYLLGKKALPKTRPCVREVIRQIASLGGFLGRKCDGEPGVKSLWIGMQRIRDFVQGMEFMKKTHAL